MPVSTPSPRTARLPVVRVVRPLYLTSFLEDFVLLYPVYAVLFSEHGLSTARISVLFALWSLMGILLEVPSGVLADRVSRKLLLVVAPLLTAAGFALWTFRPGFAAFAAGFVLWGAGGALRSGAREALVYEELERVGAADRYPAVMGRAAALATLAVAAATGLAAPVLALTGYRGAGIASIAACLLCAAAAVAFPEHRAGRGASAPAGAPAEEEGGEPLRVTVRRVRRTPPLRYAVLAVPATIVLWEALDEYVGLLAVEQGVAVAAVPLVVLVVYGGAALGGLLGGRLGLAGRQALPAALAAGAVPLVAAGLVGGVAGAALVALAFCAFQAAQVAADAQLQAAITGPARATITSFAGLLSDVAIIGVYAAYGAAALAASHATLFAVGGLVYLVIAAALCRRAGTLDSRGTEQVC